MVWLTDHLDMAMRIDYDKYPKIAPGVSHIYIVWSQIHQNKGADVLLALKTRGHVFDLQLH